MAAPELKKPRVEDEVADFVEEEEIVEPAEADIPVCQFITHLVACNGRSLRTRPVFGIIR